MRATPGLPTLKCSKHICSIYLGLEKFKKPKSKDNNDKFGLELWGMIAWQINKDEDWWRGQGLLAWTSAGEPRPYAHVWAKWRGSRKETFLELLDVETQRTATPEPIGEVLTGAIIIMGRCRDAMVGGIKVKVWMKIRMFEQTLYDVVMFPLSECVIGMYIMSDWGALLLPNIIK